MSDTLLSIIIPTRNRYSTLLPVIESILMHLRRSDFEVVIQDNSEDNAFIIEYLKGSYDARLKYFYSPEQLSMVKNSERAIENSKGNYLLFIGDDDNINPIIMDVVEEMEANNIDSLIYPIANYYYNDVKFDKAYGFNRPGALSFSNNAKGDFCVLNTKGELQRVIQSGGIFIMDLPRLYHGIVKMDLMLKVRETYGKFVPGPCPDMTTSAAIATLITSHWRFSLPLSIAGNSSLSEGGKGPTNSHIVKLEDKNWLDQSDILDWNPSIPRIFSRETIWAQSVYHVLSLKNPKIELNYRVLYDSMIFSSPGRALKYVNPLYNMLKTSPWNRLKYYTLAYGKRYIRKFLFLLPSAALDIATKLRGDFKTKVLINNVNSISECMDILSDVSRKKYRSPLKKYSKTSQV